LCEGKKKRQPTQDKEKLTRQVEVGVQVVVQEFRIAVVTRGFGGKIQEYRGEGRVEIVVAGGKI
jgi:hypothetical protein